MAKIEGLVEGQDPSTPVGELLIELDKTQIAQELATLIEKQAYSWGVTALEVRPLITALGGDMRVVMDCDHGPTLAIYIVALLLAERVK